MKLRAVKHHILTRWMEWDYVLVWPTERAFAGDSQPPRIPPQHNK
jgi:hypothetical protein